MKEWYPGSFSFLLTANGVATSQGRGGPWSGRRQSTGEKMVTRPVSSLADPVVFGFSHIHTKFSWKRTDIVKGPVEATEEKTRLEFLVKNCGFSATAFQQLPEDALPREKLLKHEAVAEGKGPIKI